MALRPLAFGLRLLDKGRSVRVRAQHGDLRRYVVEETRAGGKTQRREHSCAASAVRDAAASWRKRLH